jgi:hypothetical protein
MTWWTGVPRRVLRIFAAMIPRLTAEESLLAAERIAVGVGRLPRHDARALVSRWQRAARAGRERAQPITPVLLAASGIRVVREPRPA